MRQSNDVGLADKNPGEPCNTCGLYGRLTEDNGPFSIPVLLYLYYLAYLYPSIHLLLHPLHSPMLIYIIHNFY